MREVLGIVFQPESHSKYRYSCEVCAALINTDKLFKHAEYHLMITSALAQFENELADLKAGSI